MMRIKLLYDRKSGEDFYQDESCIIQNRSAHSFYQKGAEQYMGHGARMIIYRAAKNIAKKRFCGIVRNFKKPDEDTMRIILDHLILCGYGLFEIKSFGEETLVELRNSHNALGYRSERPVCYVTSGYLAGIMELITGKESICIEEKCIAKGDKACTFRISKLPSGSDAEPVKEFWKKTSPPKDCEEFSVDYDDTKGEVLFNGVNSSINARADLSEFQREFQRMIGPAYKTIIYEVVGKGPSAASLGQMRRFVIKVMRVFSKRKIAEKLVEEFSKRGFGTTEILEFDEKRQSGRVLIRNSHNALGYRSNEPVCHATAGVFANGGELMFGKKMICRETKCIAKGDEHCEFELYPERPA
jgi:predicted hydrocarbon binding protein